MGLIHGTIPQPIHGTIPQGKGREGIGREWRNYRRLRLPASSLCEDGRSASMHGDATRRGGR